MESFTNIHTPSKIDARFIFRSFIIGAIVGSLGDFVHLITKTDIYPVGFFPFIPFIPVDMPVWVPFHFGIAVALMASLHKLLSPLYHPKMAHSRTFASVAPMIFAILYAMTGLIQAGMGLQDIWIASAAIILWWMADGTFTGAIIALFTALCGTCFEILLVSAGVFFYYKQHAQLCGVPTWLPWLYAAASICISLFARWI